MLELLLEIFKENALVALTAAAVTSFYALLFKGDAAVPSLWRRAAISTTVMSMVIGLYWIPAQRVWYLVLGGVIVLVSCVLNAQEIAYTEGNGFETRRVSMNIQRRIAAFLPALWLPFALPSLQWFLHRSMREIISPPGSANPMLHLRASVVNCLAATTMLVASTFIIDRFLHRRVVSAIL